MGARPPRRFAAKDQPAGNEKKLLSWFAKDLQAFACTRANMGMGMITAGMNEVPLVSALIFPDSESSLKSQMVAS